MVLELRLVAVGFALLMALACQGADVTDGDASPLEAGAPPSVDAAPGCRGTRFEEICWYLAADGQSCDDACSARGGFNPESVHLIGSLDQGGSLEQCASVLAMLRGNANAVIQATIEEKGIGCHLYGAAEDRWWLTEPAFEPAATWDKVQIVCGCNE